MAYPSEQREFLTLNTLATVNIGAAGAKAVAVVPYSRCILDRFYVHVTDSDAMNGNIELVVGHQGTNTTNVCPIAFVNNAQYKTFYKVPVTEVTLYAGDLVYVNVVNTGGNARTAYPFIAIRHAAEHPANNTKFVLTN